MLKLAFVQRLGNKKRGGAGGFRKKKKNMVKCQPTIAKCKNIFRTNRCPPLPVAFSHSLLWIEGAQHTKTNDEMFDFDVFIDLWSALSTYMFHMHQIEFEIWNATGCGMLLMRPKVLVKLNQRGTSNFGNIEIIFLSFKPYTICV